MFFFSRSSLVRFYARGWKERRAQLYKRKNLSSRDIVDRKSHMSTCWNWHKTDIYGTIRWPAFRMSVAHANLHTDYYRHMRKVLFAIIITNWNIYARVPRANMILNKYHVAIRSVKLLEHAQNCRRNYGRLARDRIIAEISQHNYKVVMNNI